MDLLGCLEGYTKKNWPTDNEYLASIDKCGLNLSVTCDKKLYS